LVADHTYGGHPVVLFAKGCMRLKSSLSHISDWQEHGFNIASPDIQEAIEQLGLHYNEGETKMSLECCSHQWQTCSMHTFGDDKSFRERKFLHEHDRCKTRRQNSSYLRCAAGKYS
jgi:hypothetical protein